MNAHDAHRIEVKEAALRFLTHTRDRYRQRGQHEVADAMTVRIRDLDLEIRAIREGRP